MLISFSNAENLVFTDNQLTQMMQKHFSIFEQWRLGKRIPYLRNMGKKAILDFLNVLDDDDIELLENYFGEKIEIEKLNYNIAVDYKILLSETEICKTLCTIESLNNFSTWRDDKYLYISTWK